MTADQPIRILFVEDVPADMELAGRVLRKEGLTFTATRVETKDDFLAALSAFTPDIIISDYAMPEFDGLTALKLALAHDASLPFIVLTGSLNEETAVTCIKAGATDYVLKERIARLPFAVTEALEQQTVRLAKEAAERALRESEAKFRSYIGHAPLGVFVVDRLGHYVEVNAAATELLGYTEAELLHLSIPDVLAPQSFEAGLQRFQMVIDTGSAAGELLFRRKAGTSFWASVNAVRLDDNHFMAYCQDISGRKQTEETIRRTEARFRALIENAPDGIVLVRTDGRFKYVSPAALRIFGYRAEDIIGANPAKSTHPDDLPVVLRTLHSLIQDPSRVSTLQYRFKHGNGAWHWVEGTFSNMLAEPSVEAIVINFRDITERKRAEEALRFSEDRFQLAMQGANDGLWDWNLKTDEVYYSPRWKSMLGYAEAELDNHLDTWKRLVHPDQRESTLALVRDLIEGRADKFEVEFQMQHKDGHFLDILSRAFLLRDPQGEAVRLVGTHVDITARKRAEEALQNNEKRFRALIENGLDNISLLAVDGTLLWESPAVVRTLDYAPDQFLGRDLFELVHPADADWVRRVFAETLQEPAGRRHGSFRLRHSSGAWRWVEAVATNLLDEPSVTAIVINYRDITERRQAEESLRDSEERFRSFIEQSADGVALLDEQGNVIEWNLAQAQITGIPRAQALGASFADIQFQILPPERRSGRSPEHFRQAMQDSFRTGQAAQFGKPVEIEIQSTTGARKTITQTSFPIKTAKGYRLGGIVRDVTEHKQAEEALRESEAKFRDMAEQMVDVLFVTDTHGLITYISPSASRVFGWQPGELIGRNFVEFIPTAGAPRASGDFRAMLEFGKSIQHIDVTMARKDGSVFSGELSATILRKAERVAGTIGLIRDITARKQAETALLESERRYHALFDQVPVSLWEEDYSDVRASFQHLRETGVRDFRRYFDARPDEVIRLASQVKIVDVNRYTLELYEAASQEALSQGFGIVFGPESYEVFKAELVALAEGVKQYQVETVNYTLRGKRRYINLQLSVPTGYEDTLARVLVSITDITERKRIEGALRESEAQFRTLFEVSPDAIMLIDPHDNWCISDCNTAACQMNGYTRDELIGQSVDWLNLTPGRPAERAEYLEQIQRLGVLRLETFHRRKDGTIFPIEVSTSLITLGGRDVVLGIDRDITERKRAEELLRLQSAALNAAANAIVITDREQHIQWINPAFTALTGYTAEEAVGKDLRELARSGIHDRAFYDDHDQTVEAGHSWHGEIVNRRKDGHLYHEEQTITPVHDARGTITHTIAIKQDITARKKRERELEAIAAMATALRAASTRADMLPVIVHQVFNLLQADGAALISRDPATGGGVISYAQGIGADSTGLRIPRDSGIVGHVIATGRPYVTRDAVSDSHVDRPDRGSELTAVSCAPLVAHDQTIGALWIGRQTAITDEELRILMAMADIAANALQRAQVLETLEQRVADRTHELAAANTRLQELDRLKSKFVSDVSHELRTPITALSLNVDLLEHGKPAKREQYMQAIRQQVQRQAQLIEDILNLSRLELGADKVRFGSVALNSLVTQVVAVHQTSADAKNLMLTFTPQPDLPAVRGEENQLAQVIANLVGNAVNYTLAGEIRVRTAATDYEVLLEVRDTGLGIAPDDLPHLFERFYRGSRTQQIRGTGLGLAIVKEIVVLHDGRIEVESEAGVGTTFRVYLPINAALH